MRKFISPAKKSEILTYIETYNARNGRGGKVAAAKKFKVSRVAIDSWLAQGASRAGKARPPAARTTEILQVLVALDVLQRSLPGLTRNLGSLAKKL